MGFLGLRVSFFRFKSLALWEMVLSGEDGALRDRANDNSRNQDETQLHTPVHPPKITTEEGPIDLSTLERGKGPGSREKKRESRRVLDLNPAGHSISQVQWLDAAAMPRLPHHQHAAAFGFLRPFPFQRVHTFVHAIFVLTSYSFICIRMICILCFASLCVFVPWRM